MRCYQILEPQIIRTNIDLLLNISCVLTIQNSLEIVASNKIILINRIACTNTNIKPPDFFIIINTNVYRMINSLHVPIFYRKGCFRFFEKQVIDVKGKKCPVIVVIKGIFVIFVYNTPVIKAAGNAKLFAKTFCILSC